VCEPMLPVAPVSRIRMASLWRSGHQHAAVFRHDAGGRLHRRVGVRPAGAARMGRRQGRPGSSRSDAAPV
jgi:hypothetical protein